MCCPVNENSSVNESRQTAFGEAPGDDIFSSQFAQSAITQSSMNVRPSSTHDEPSSDLLHELTGTKVRRASTSTTGSHNSWKRYIERNISQQDLRSTTDLAEVKKGHRRKRTGSGNTGFTLPFFKRRTSVESSSKTSTGSLTQNDIEVEIYAI